METSPKYDNKNCSRCGKEFVCKSGNITQCQCFNVQLSKDELIFIKEIYDDCLCLDCLIKMKQIYRERKILDYFTSVKQDNN